MLISTATRALAATSSSLSKLELSPHTCNSAVLIFVCLRSRLPTLPSPLSYPVSIIGSRDIIPHHPATLSNFNLEQPAVFTGIIYSVCQHHPHIQHNKTHHNSVEMPTITCTTYSKSQSPFCSAANQPKAPTTCTKTTSKRPPTSRSFSQHSQDSRGSTTSSSSARPATTRTSSTSSSGSTEKRRPSLGFS